MASGRQLSEENVATFRAWVASKSSADFRGMTMRGVLNRTEIAKECGFAKSALAQNPQIREGLATLEGQLRDAGVLPSVAKPGLPSADPPSRTDGSAAGARDAERLNRLEQENALLRAEVSELKRQLGKFGVLRDVLADTGRIPR